MAMLTRRNVLMGGGAVLAAGGGAGYWLTRGTPVPIGFDVADDELARARAFLATHPAIDAHAHPGRTFARGAEHLAMKVRLYVLLGSFEQATVSDMKAGGLAAASFSAVADFQTLDFVGNGLQSVRQFEPGEAWASYKRQIGNLTALSARGLVHPVKTVADVAAAHAAGVVGAFLTVEGGDFLEGRPERVAEAFADGVRSITLMHYRGNELGDIITDNPRHGRLTEAGAAVVKAMNAAGMLIDVAHASEATAFGAVRVSSKPVMASHVHVQNQTLSNARFISMDLAKAVAETGGGILGAWPAGIGITDLRGFLDRTFELIEAVGIDHVCMGTDMDANYKPAFDTYAKLPHYVAGLFKRGLPATEVAKLIGGNFLRVFGAAQAV